jgi:hypothetical protein
MGCDTPIDYYSQVVPMTDPALVPRQSIDLVAIEARLSDAEEGPYRLEICDRLYGYYTLQTVQNRRIAEIWGDEGRARFLASSWEDITALVEEVKRLRAALLAVPVPHQEEQERIAELLAQFGVLDTDTLKHRLEDWQRWQTEHVRAVPTGEGLRAPQDGLLHPAHQVFFRAGLLACREYMARFVEAESPSIAMSIRANWWPALGADFGPPRKLAFAEVTSGIYGEADFRVKTAGEVSPTQEALPIALAFLDAPSAALTAPPEPTDA